MFLPKVIVKPWNGADSVTPFRGTARIVEQIKLKRYIYVKKMESKSTESSLTSPSDRDLNNRWKPDQNFRKLTEKEVDNAITELNDLSFVNKFPRVDRTYADPAIPLQTFSLFSFMPAKGAKPNENGVFGFAKIRGSYGTELETNQRAEYLIRNIDSYHKLFHTYVGRPFPVTISSKYSANTDEIDIRKEMTQAVSSSIKTKKDKERREAEEIKEREEKLLKETRSDGPEDPYETYITLRVKKAQLSWTYLEHLKKIDEIKDIIIKTRKDVDNLDREHVDFKDKYFDKYMEAREQAGLKTNKEEQGDNFMKFLVEDAVLPGID